MTKSQDNDDPVFFGPYDQERRQAHLTGERSSAGRITVFPVYVRVQFQDSIYHPILSLTAGSEVKELGSGEILENQFTYEIPAFEIPLVSSVRFTWKQLDKVVREYDIVLKELRPLTFTPVEGVRPLGYVVERLAV